MAAGKNYDMATYPVQVAVRSQSDGAAVHMVTLPYCDCADFTNRKGRVVDSDATGKAVTVCKHMLEALERIGGWHRQAAPETQTVTHDQLTRATARTLMTSAYLSAELADRLLVAAGSSSAGGTGIAAVIATSTGQVSVQYDSAARRYSVTLPADQPVSMPTAQRGLPVFG
jgi:hypothetical protein